MASASEDKVIQLFTSSESIVPTFACASIVNIFKEKIDATEFLYRGSSAINFPQRCLSLFNKSVYLHTQDTCPEQLR